MLDLVILQVTMRTYPYLVAFVFVAHCGQQAQTSSDAGRDVTTTNDAAPDVGPADATIVDATDAADAAEAEAAAPPPHYNDVTSLSNWEAFDITTIVGKGIGYWGGAFDGRYVYYMPNNYAGVFHAQLLRYDTHGAFTSMGCMVQLRHEHCKFERSRQYRRGVRRHLPLRHPV